MDRGDHLPVAAKRQVRRFVTRLCRLDLSEREDLVELNMVFAPSHPLRVYALAYWQAVRTAAPLDLPRVRDSGS